MRNPIKPLKGSPATDEFRYRHKQELPGHFYALDIDFVLVNRQDPIAVLDYKTTGDKITFTEGLMYNWFVRNGVPVFIILSKHPKTGPFDIYRYYGGEIYQYPDFDVELAKVDTCENWDEFYLWERTIREEHEQYGGIGA